MALILAFFSLFQITVISDYSEDLGYPEWWGDLSGIVLVDFRGEIGNIATDKPVILFPPPDKSFYDILYNHLYERPMKYVLVIALRRTHILVVLTQFVYP